MQVVSEAAGAPHLVGVVDSLDELVRVLDREGIDAVHADYWIAYRLGLRDRRAHHRLAVGRALRYPPYDDTVSATPTAPPGSWPPARARRRRCASGSTSSGVGYRVLPAGDLSVVLTDRNVQPEELPNEARTPEGWEMAPPPGESY